jgi:hypothetical protein
VLLESVQERLVADSQQRRGFAPIPVHAMKSRDDQVAQVVCDGLLKRWIELED